MLDEIMNGIVAPIFKIIDKIIPDPAEADRIKLELMKAENQQVLEEAKIQLSAIITEAQSADPWTSRARPTFLYVIYALILFSLPMGLLFAYRPDVAGAVITGFHNWLAAIPESYLQLFGVGYLGYTGARTFDKWKSNTK